MAQGIVDMLVGLPSVFHHSHHHRSLTRFKLSSCCHVMSSPARPVSSSLIVLPISRSVDRPVHFGSSCRRVHSTRFAILAWHVSEIAPLYGLRRRYTLGRRQSCVKCTRPRRRTDARHSYSPPADEQASLCPLVLLLSAAPNSSPWRLHLSQPSSSSSSAPPYCARHSFTSRRRPYSVQNDGTRLRTQAARARSSNMRRSLSTRESELRNTAHPSSSAPRHSPPPSCPCQCRP